MARQKPREDTRMCCVVGHTVSVLLLSSRGHAVFLRVEVKIEGTENGRKYLVTLGAAEQLGCVRLLRLFA